MMSHPTATAPSARAPPAATATTAAVAQHRRGTPCTLPIRRRSGASILRSARTSRTEGESVITKSYQDGPNRTARRAAERSSSDGTRQCTPGSAGTATTAWPGPQNPNRREEHFYRFSTANAREERVDQSPPAGRGAHVTAAGRPPSGWLGQRFPDRLGLRSLAAVPGRGAAAGSQRSLPAGSSEPLCCPTV
jgi:hypothetical protein